jgi:formylglycine-generating enzyme required for sulfatase activity
MSDKPRTDIAMPQPTGIAIPDKAPPAKAVPQDSWMPRKDLVKRWAVMKELNHYEVLELAYSATGLLIQGRIAILELRLDLWSDSMDAQLQEIGRQGRGLLVELRAAFVNKAEYDSKLAMKRRMQIITSFQQQAEEAVEKVLRWHHYRALTEIGRKRGMSADEIEGVMNTLRAEGVEIETEDAPSGPISEKGEPAKQESAAVITVSIAGGNLMTEKAQPPPAVKAAPLIIPAGLILVQGGIFLMGDKSIKAAPVHQVTLSNFMIGQSPVTFSEYDRYCQETNIPLVWDKGWGKENRPVINVSWADAIRFCNWKSRTEGLAVAYNEGTGELLDSSGSITTDITQVEGYCLPTEAEWEYAARGGNKSKGYVYSGSNNIDEVAWYDKNSGGKTHPVGEKQSNELGLYDMSGNVYEWVQDWYSDSYYDSLPSSNPVGHSDGSSRVSRGGSWIYGPLFCRTAYRFAFDPNLRRIFLGFRLRLSAR